MVVVFIEDESAPPALCSSLSRESAHSSAILFPFSVSEAFYLVPRILLEFGSLPLRLILFVALVSRMRRIG